MYKLKDLRYLHIDDSYVRRAIVFHLAYLGERQGVRLYWCAERKNISLYGVSYYAVVYGN